MAVHNQDVLGNVPQFASSFGSGPVRAGPALTVSKVGNSQGQRLLGSQQDATFFFLHQSAGKSQQLLLLPSRIHPAVRGGNY